MAEFLLAKYYVGYYSPGSTVLKLIVFVRNLNRESTKNLVGLLMQRKG